MVFLSALRPSFGSWAVPGRLAVRQGGCCPSTMAVLCLLVSPTGPRRKSGPMDSGTGTARGSREKREGGGMGEGTGPKGLAVRRGHPAAQFPTLVSHRGKAEAHDRQAPVRRWRPVGMREHWPHWYRSAGGSTEGMGQTRPLWERNVEVPWGLGVGPGPAQGLSGGTGVQ